MKIKRLFYGVFPAFLLTIFAACGGNPAPVPSDSPAPAPPALPDELDAAIREASDYLNERLPKGNKLVILNIQSDFPALSEYIIDELIANTVNDRVFSVVDRQQLAAIRAEMEFQLSGEVSDESAQRLGELLGAQTIVSGAVSRLGDLYRLRVRALSVQSAQIEGQFNRNMPEGSTITALVRSQSTGYGGGSNYGGTGTGTGTAGAQVGSGQPGTGQAAASGGGALTPGTVPGGGGSETPAAPVSAVAPAPAPVPTPAPVVKVNPDPAEFRLLRTITVDDLAKTAVFSPDGTKIAGAISSKQAKIIIWNINNGQAVKELDSGSTWAFDALAYSPDGRRVVSKKPYEVSRIWDANTGAYRIVSGGPESSIITSLSYRPDGKRFAANDVNRYGKVGIYDGNNGQFIQSVGNTAGGVTSVAYSPDGKWLASFCSVEYQNDLIKIWDAETHLEVLSINAGYGEQDKQHLCWSPDSSMIAANTTGNNIKIWNAATGQEIWTLTGHRGFIGGIGFSLDGKKLVSGSRDKTIKIWDVESGWEVKTIQSGHTSEYMIFAYSPDGRYFLTTSQDNTIKIWGVE